MRGVIEGARIMLAIAKVEYEDKRYPLDTETFAMPEFNEAKAAGLFATNLDRAPTCTVDGVTFGQSKAIERYIAKKYGFWGSTDIEGAQIDMLAEHCRDVKQKYADARAGKKDEELAAAKAAFVGSDLASWAAKIEKCLIGTDGYSVGSKLSYADVALFLLVKDHFDDKEGAVAAFACAPKVLAAVAKVEEAAADWLASRPVTKF